MGKRGWHDDERIGRADQETELFQRADFGAQIRDRIAQCAPPCGGRCCKSIFIFSAFQSLFGSGEIRVGRVRLLLPAITGGWLEIRWRASARRQAVGIGAVGVHIHVGREQKRFWTSLRMLKLQNSLAIEKVVSRQEEIQATKVLTQHFDFCVVKLREQRRNRIGGNHRRQTGKQRRQLGTDFGQFLNCFVRRRHARQKLEIEYVTVRQSAFGRSIRSVDRLHGGVKGDSVEQFCGVQFSRDYRWPRRGRFRCRRTQYFRGCEALQPLKGDPAIHNRSKKRTDQKQHESPPYPKAIVSHATTFSPRRQWLQ